MENNDNERQSRVEEMFKKLVGPLGDHLKQIISLLENLISRDKTCENNITELKKHCKTIGDNSADIANKIKAIHSDIETIKDNTKNLKNIQTLKSTIFIAIATSLIAGLIITLFNLLIINPTLNKIGQLYKPFGTFLRNHTNLGTSFSEQEIKGLESQLPKAPKETPYIDFIPVGWRQIKTISGDYGIRAAVIVDNSNALVEKLHIVDEYYIRVENLPDVQSYFSEASEEFDRKKEDILVLHSKEIIKVCKIITQFFEEKYTPNIDSAEIQKILTAEGIKLQVYGQEKEYYFEPRILRPKQQYSYEYGRSTGQEWLESAILDKGTNMLVVVSILEYQTKDDCAYRSFLISRSESGRGKFLRTIQGFLYYPLVEVKEWYTKIE